jgi:hypothetical protein
MGARHIRKRRGAEREYTREKASKVFKLVCGDKILVFYGGIGYVQEIARRCDIREVVEDSIG